MPSAATFGPYKLSLHSGSDKFSVYPIVARLTGGLTRSTEMGQIIVKFVSNDRGNPPGKLADAELLAVARKVAASVQAQFGVGLEPEPRILGADF